MSCPDWRRLAALREAQPELDPPGWEAIRRHLASCPACRREAVAADPLLAFTRLAEPPADPGMEHEMQGAVAAMIRAARLETPRRSARAAGLAKLAAGLGTVALLMFSGSPPGRAPEPGNRAAADALRIDQGPAAAILEDLDRPGARIYELPQDDLAVVMIVDSSLDV